MRYSSRADSRKRAKVFKNLLRNRKSSKTVKFLIIDLKNLTEINIRMHENVLCSTLINMIVRAGRIVKCLKCKTQRAEIGVETPT